MQGDARHFAASILQRLQQTYLKHTFCCYGTQNSVLIGIGRTSSLMPCKYDTLDAVWANINQFIQANASEYIFGFIGFDPANQLHKKTVNYQRKIDLFVADTVIACSSDGCKLIKGDMAATIFEDLPEPDEARTIDIRKLDQAELKNQYAESVSHFINAIKEGSIERTTLARKIPFSGEFNLANTFIADHSRHDLARSFYFSNEQIAFAGQSPELLAEGTCQSFATHKLSGTHAKQDGVPIAMLIQQFKNDPRIVAEHYSAITTIENSLNNIGQVDAIKFQVMELPALLHGWSRFITQPKQDASITDCLRTIFPFGANPVIPAFKLLAQHENFCRGPYYGLTGVIQPDGRFSFTQVLRSVFVDKYSSYLMIGAAITAHSTPELETTETCTKLNSIRAFNKLV